MRTLKQIAKKCNINNPEEVKETIADLNWKNNTKTQFIITYIQFLKYLGLKWEKLVRTGMNLINDMHIVDLKDTIKSEPRKRYGAEYDYNAEILSDGDYCKIQSALTTDERRKREPNVAITPEELISQVANLPKWETLKSVATEIKSVSS
jgi:hypothetical protein